MKYQAVKGMNDILPDEIGRWHRLEKAFRETVELCGFREIRTPIVEPTALFVRSIGEATDIVEKEMYRFKHHSNDLTIRPEGTAGAVRAYVEHHMDQKEPISRWYYLGPMFRGERPARGRYRQFYQLGCESIGDPGPAGDAEMIDMLAAFFRRLGIDEFQVMINSLGGPGTRPLFRDALVAHLDPLRAKLSEDSQRRIDTNPLRILDSKDPRDIEALKGAPSILDLLDGPDLQHWNQLRAHLDKLGTPYVVEPTLVRGLDYYTRTLFEFRSTSSEVGAQNALGGGGRYDGLVEELGGPKTPAIGFAVGIERTLLAMKATDDAQRPLCVLTPMGAEAASEALLVARELRNANVQADVDSRGGAGTSLKVMLRRANSMKAGLCLIIGDSELQAQTVQVKDLAGHAQHIVPRAEITAFVLAHFAKETSTGGSV